MKKTTGAFQNKSLETEPETLLIRNDLTFYVYRVHKQLCFTVDLHYKDQMYREKPSQTLMSQRM